MSFSEFRKDTEAPLKLGEGLDRYKVQRLFRSRTITWVKGHLEGDIICRQDYVICRIREKGMKANKCLLLGTISARDLYI